MRDPKTTVGRVDLLNNPRYKFDYKAPFYSSIWSIWLKIGRC